MQLRDIIFGELRKQGYSLRGNKRVWDISDGKLWCLTKELVRRFETFEKYAPYKENVVEPEIKLLKNNAKQIISLLETKKFNIIDLGCGNGRKAEALICSLPKDIKVRYYAVDVSKILVRKAVNLIKKIGKSKVVSVKGFCADFMEFDDLEGLARSPEYQKNLVLLLGGTISHLDVHDALYRLSKDLFTGDVFVAGNGLRKGKRFVSLTKYKVPQLHNWFIHNVKEIGFNEEELKFDARFSHGRLELYYTFLVDKKVSFRGKNIYFRKGDEILVALQYKFFDKEVVGFCKMYFGEGKLLKSPGGEFCLAICKK